MRYTGAVIVDVENNRYAFPFDKAYSLDVAIDQLILSLMADGMYPVKWVLFRCEEKVCGIDAFVFSDAVDVSVQSIRAMVEDKRSAV